MRHHRVEKADNVNAFVEHTCGEFLRFGGVANHDRHDRMHAGLDGYAPLREGGAKVISEPRRGYGRACAAGIRSLSLECDVVVSLDGDGSDCPELMNQLIDPIAAEKYDFVIGSRTRGQRERGSMNAQQIFAGRFAGWLLSILYGVRYTDMCPFRAIRRDALERLGMREKTYGWNLEMQMRAARAGLRILEVPVNHRCRAGGKSKVSGTMPGTFVAGARILATFLRVMLERN